MNRLTETIARLQSEKRKILVGYLMGGFPTLDKMDRAARDLAAEGADVLEVGVPFSDPIADGPVIQGASQEALSRGTTLSLLLGWAQAFRRRQKTPLVFMSYLNPILSFGLKRFARSAAAAGVDGLIVPDLIPEEAGETRHALSTCGLCLIHLAAPTTPPQRRRWISAQSQGFLYAVSLTGVTGAKVSWSSETRRFLEDMRRHSPVPVLAGFGVSTPEDARTLGAWADGVIVGSALVKRLRQGEPLGPFIRRLSHALNNRSKEIRHARG